MLNLVEIQFEKKRQEALALRATAQTGVDRSPSPLLDKRLTNHRAGFQCICSLIGQKKGSRRVEGWQQASCEADLCCLSLLVLHDEKELRVADFAIFVNVKLSNAPLSLGLLVPFEAAGDDSEHLVFRDIATLISVKLAELLSDLGLGLSTAVEGIPQLGKFRLVDPLVSILVRLMDQSNRLTLSHGSSNLLNEGPEFLAGDDAIAIRVKELESLSQFLLGRHHYLLNLCL